MQKMVFLTALLIQLTGWGQGGFIDTIYVSPSGHDQWSGMLPTVNAKGTDGPLGSLEKARAYVQERLKKGQYPKGGFVVLLRGGTYPLRESLILDKRLATPEGVPLVWTNYPGEQVLVSGGQAVTGFTPVRERAALKRILPALRKHILVLSLKASGIQDFGTITNRGRPGLELFFKGEKMPLSRWPNEGWDTIAGVPQDEPIVFKGDPNRMNEGFPRGRHSGRIAYRGNRPDTWSHLSDIALYGYWVHNWHDEFVRVHAIDKVKKEIALKPPHSRYGYTKGQGFYAVNILEELDQPGEWYLEHATGRLFFWPPSSLAEAEVVVSLSDRPLIQVDSLSNVRLEGLQFAYTRGHAVVFRGGQNNLVGGCSFHHLGDVALRLEGGENNGVRSSDFFALAAGGIVLSGGDRKTLTAARNFAINNHIHHFGQWLKTHQSAITVSGVGNYLAHNLIHHGPNSGITLSGNEHLLEYNELHHLGQETADVGAFYMGRNWTQRGNIIRYNYFHDLHGPGADYVNGVYLDDFTSGTTVHGNLFLRCSKGIEVGGGRDNTISNNLFVDCLLGISIDARGLDWARYYFEGKDSSLYRGMSAMNYAEPPYSEKYPILLSLYGDEPAVPKNNRVINNISYGGKWIRLLYGIDFSVVHCAENLVSEPGNQYRHPNDFIVAGNPGIFDYEKGGLRLDEISTTKYGFKPIPIDKIGLENDSFRLHPLKSFTHH